MSSSSQHQQGLLAISSLLGNQSLIRLRLIAWWLGNRFWETIFTFVGLLLYIFVVSLFAVMPARATRLWCANRRTMLSKTQCPPGLGGAGAMCRQMFIRKKTRRRWATYTRVNAELCRDTHGSILLNISEVECLLLTDVLNHLYLTDVSTALELISLYADLLSARNLFSTERRPRGKTD